MNMQYYFNVGQLILAGLILFNLFGHVIQAKDALPKPSEGGKVLPSQWSHGHKTKYDKQKDLKTCSSRFEGFKTTIIRTHDSLDKGAKFLKATNAKSVDECKLECCEENNSNSCDLATFQEYQKDGDENQPRCFLFSCTDDEGNFLCKTSYNGDYVVLKRISEPHVADQLLDVAKDSTEATETTISHTSSIATTSAPQQTKPTTLKSTTTSTTLKTTTTSTTALSTSTMPTSTTSTTQISIQSTSETSLPTKATLLTSLISTTTNCVKECERMEWECDNGCCVKVTEVCNGKIECSDSSDEAQCDSLSDKNVKSSSTSVKEKKQDAVKSTTPHADATSASSSESENAVTELVEEFFSEEMNGQKSVLLPLVLGLAVTICILLMVICRLRVMRNKLRRRGKPLSMEESDYLINGMYL